jgi:uncharacterized protein (TIGR00661 family)
MLRFSVMRILYGVVGEGMGHAMRSRVVLEHLVGQGHEVQIMASGRACGFLEKRFAGVNRIHGFHMIMEENRVRVGKTVWSNVLAGTQAVPGNIAAYFELASQFKPEVVVSDFESWTYLYAKTHRLPILSIDNMQIINRCTHPPEVLAEDETAFRLAKTFIKGKLPFCNAYYVTTFFRPPVRKPSTRLFPPILRPEITEAKATRGDHLLVYQTGEGYEGLAKALDDTGLECRIYGMRRDLKAEQVEGSKKNLRYRPFSEDVFIQDLASARAVIAGGGFTLMGEAVYLHKPMLAVPLASQFEQIMNARYLELEGYGKYAANLDDPKPIFAFLENVPRYEDRLARYHQDGNKELLGALDEFLDRAAVGIA